MSGGHIEVLVPIFAMISPTNELVNVNGRLVRRWRGMLMPSGAAVDVYTVGVRTDDPAGQEILKQVMQESERPDWVN